MSATPPDMTEHLTWKHNYKKVYYRYLQGIFIVSKDGNKYGLVDEKNTSITPLQYDEMDYFTYPDKIICAKENGKWGIMDDQGNLVAPCKYEAVKRFLFYDLIFVRYNNKWGVLSAEGKEIVPCKYYYIKDLEHPDTTIKAYSRGQGFEIDFSGKILK